MKNYIEKRFDTGVVDIDIDSAGELAELLAEELKVNGVEKPDIKQIRKLLVILEELGIEFDILEDYYEEDLKEKFSGELKAKYEQECEEYNEYKEQVIDDYNIVKGIW